MVYLKKLTVTWAGKKKTNTYITVPRGAHPQDKCIPLVVVLRDLLKIADNSREARSVITSGKIIVDGNVCRDMKRGIGLFDVIEIPDLKKAYRMIIRGKPRLIEIPVEEAKKKLCRVTGKTVLKKGKLQLNLHDGKNIITDVKDYSVNDSVLLSLPDQKISENVKFGPGCLVMINNGSVVKLKNVIRGLHRKMVLDDGKEIPLKNFIVVGIDKPIIKVSE